MLIVGCGISTEPALIARLGYEVLAIDVSKVAIEHLEQHPATDDELANSLVLSLPETAWTRGSGGGKTLALEGIDLHDALTDTLRTLTRPGGSLELRCVDFRELAPDQLFDVVYSPWSWQCLDAERRAELPRKAFDWLVPGGAAFFATQNLSAFPALDDELTTACASAGFVRRPYSAGNVFPLEKWPLSPRDQERFDELCAADDVELHSQLAAGAKVWAHFRASG